MKILKLKLFQETACYKKPFSYKVAETYPLPPYSTVIGMFHKILEAQSGQYFPMDISIQGEFESIFSNYQTLRMYKEKEKITSMPRNVHQLLNISLILHIRAEDEIIDRIYENILSGKVSFTLGRNEDLIRIDGINMIEKIHKVPQAYLTHNAYVPIKEDCDNIHGINYRLNSIYTIDKNELRKWEKVAVKYVEKDTNEVLEDVLQDEDGDLVLFYQ